MLEWLRKLFGATPAPVREPTDTSPGGVYTGLRRKALSIRRNQVGIGPSTSTATVWGGLMEIGRPRTTASLFVLVDGTASLYLSSGGGVIGGQAHDTVRAAGARFLETANALAQHLKLTTTYPLPAVEQTLFYLLTDDGILTAGDPDDDLGNGRHPLSSLFHAGHGVLTQLRLVSTKPQ
jgi:hypothetical protein